MELKTLRIEEDTHKRLKIFCANYGFKMNEWVDGIINQTLDKLENIKKDGKKINNR